MLPKAPIENMGAQGKPRLGENPVLHTAEVPGLDLGFKTSPHP